MPSSETLPLIRTTAPVPHHRPANPFRWRLRRRRRRLPTVRLGSVEGEKKRRFFLVRVCRRARVQWLKLKYMNIMRRVKEGYEAFIEDLVVSRRTTDEFHKTLVLEASVVIPVMGI